MTKNLTIGTIVAFAGLSFAGSPSQANCVVTPPTPMTTIDLGTLGGESEALAISHNGDTDTAETTSAVYVTGYSNVTVSGIIYRHAFRWRNGTMIDLGTFAGSAANSTGTGVAKTGLTVGWSEAVVGGQTFHHAFIHNGTVMTDLHNALVGAGLNPGNTSEATGINDAGIVSGWYSDAGGNAHAFQYDASHGWTLELPTGLSNAHSRAINAAGAHAGDAGSTGSVIGWVDNGTTSNIGNPGYLMFKVTGVNSDNDVTAWGYNNGGSTLPYAFDFISGQWVRLNIVSGRTDEQATGINFYNKVVGNAWSSTSGLRGVYHGQALDSTCPGGWSVTVDSLNLTVGWSLYTANAINTHGWIVGQGQGPSGQHAYLLHQ